MKKILLVLFILNILVGCKEDNDNYFDATLDAKSVSFRAVPGGAVMTYALPRSKSIMGIMITYTSASGEEMTVAGTYGSTELLIKGFLNKEDNIAAQIRYISRDNRVSDPVNVTFSTLAAGAVSIFDNIEVKPYWSGFTVTFNAPEEVDGMINIGWMGIIPSTGKLGVIIKETKAISAGENKLLFNNVTDKEENIQVVIWTEDGFQNEAKRATYDVMPRMTKMLDPSTLSYTGDSYENESKYKVGVKYLFDGDTKGFQSLKYNNGSYIFKTKMDVNNKPEGIIDLGSPQTLAYFRTYCCLNTTYVSSASPGSMVDGSWPNHFKLYASNDMNAAPEDWLEIGEYNQSKTANEVFWWCYPMFDPLREYSTPEALEEADPCFVDVKFDVLETKYRYIKIQYLSIFFSNLDNQPQSSEMEVYVQK